MDVFTVESAMGILQPVCESLKLSEGLEMQTRVFQGRRSRRRAVYPSVETFLLQASFPDKAHHTLQVK